MALHKESEGWRATELSTGKLCTKEGEKTMSAAKSEAEKNSPIILKLLKKLNQSPKEQVKPVKSAAAIEKAVNPAAKRKEQKMKKEKARHSDARPNPFAGADDIYATKNKIAVTTTKNVSSKRGHTKVTKTKYYEQNEANKRLLKKIGCGTVRLGRKGNSYKQL